MRRARANGRRVGQALALAFGFGLPVRQFGDAALRMRKPLIPGRPLGDDRGALRDARRGFAGDGLRRCARLGEGGPLTRSDRARAFEALRDLIARTELFQRGLGIGFAFGGFVARRAGA